MPRHVERLVWSAGTERHVCAAEIVVSVGMALPQNLMSIQR